MAVPSPVKDFSRDTPPTLPSPVNAPERKE